MPHTLYRSAEAPIQIRKDSDMATAILATETPVSRGGYLEILDISPEAIDLSRAPVPLLLGHAADSIPVGLVGDIRIEQAQLIGTIRFGHSQRAQEALAEVRSGVLRSVSIGYRVEKTEETAAHTKVTRWQLMEASLVAIPADPNSKITQIRSHEDSEMETVQNYQREATEIVGIAKRHNRMDLAEQAISKGMSLSQFRGFILDQLEDKPLDTPWVDDIGLTQRETRQFSITKAIEAKASGDWRNAQFERAVLDETRKHAKRSDSIVLPAEVMREYSKRDVVLGSPSNASNLVQTDVLGGSFIESLIAESVVLDRTTTLTGLVGDVAIPRMSTATSTAWYGETHTLAESAPSFDQVSMSPRTVASFLEISRRTVQQSDPSVEQLLRNDMARQIASAIDAVVIEGGGSNEPTGILQTNGIGSVALGTNGGGITYAAMVDLVKSVDQSNALGGGLAFITNPKVVAAMRQTPRQSGGVEGNFILNGDNNVLGYPVLSTTNVPSDLTKGTSSSVCSAVIFGNLRDVVVGLWSSLEIVVDPHSKLEQGLIRIRALSDVDVGIRRPESFAAIQDVTTA